MWFIESVSAVVTAVGENQSVAEIEPGGGSWIRGEGEAVFLVKVDGNTRSVIHIAADGAASVVRTKASE